MTISFNASYKADISFLTFCINYLSFAVSHVPYCNCVLLVSPFRSVSNCFIYFGVSGLGVHILICYIFMMTYPFIIAKCASLSLITFLALKSILSDESTTTLTFLWTALAQTVIFHVFTLSLCMSLEVRRVSWPFFLICVVILYFFKKDFFNLFLKRGKRNVNVWLPLIHPLLGTWPATQACALIGNWTSNP